MIIRIITQVQLNIGVAEKTMILPDDTRCSSNFTIPRLLNYRLRIRNYSIVTNTK